MSENATQTNEKYATKKFDGRILFNEIVNETIDKLKENDAAFSPEDIRLNNLWEEICYQEQAGESIYWDLYMDALKFWIEIAIEDYAEKYNSSVIDVIEAIYGEYDEEEIDYGEIETSVKEDIYDKILRYAADDKCVSKQARQKYGDAAAEDMYLSNIAMGMSEAEARQRYYGNAEEDEVEEDVAQ